MKAGIAQHFTGEKDSYITYFKGASTNDSSQIIYQLRYYPDDADCLDASDGYEVLDSIAASTFDTKESYYPQPIRCKAGGWIAVYGIGMAADANGAIILQGYDVQP